MDKRAKSKGFNSKYLLFDELIYSRRVSLYLIWIGPKIFFCFPWYVVTRGLGCNRSNYTWSALFIWNPFSCLDLCTFCSWLYGLLPEKKQLNAWKGHLMTLLLQVIFYDTNYSVRCMYLVQVHCMPGARKNWKESNVFPWHFGHALCKRTEDLF